MERTSIRQRCANCRAVKETGHGESDAEARRQKRSGTCGGNISVQAAGNISGAVGSGVADRTLLESIKKGAVSVGCTGVPSSTKLTKSNRPRMYKYIHHTPLLSV